ncbi:major facilitator superfamily domain-containing protein [Ephemerocybe angulata]|uniref:Major facilitator superfamily domain-containing protein n=1 Tax=Ephemerocybe angulata TaxID=980116 RepID=A0A8H6IE47_9AGAR|nr:major facilitator superfamily domain-containing protein [Tulosesus angulatus]
MPHPDELTRLLQDGREGRPEHTEVPWWKKQSPWWAMAVLPLCTMAVGIIVAPRIEVYTSLACLAHRPDLYEGTMATTWDTIKSVPPLCASDPKVMKVVAKLITAENTIVGVSSSLTTGLWSSLSDRTGRRTLFYIATFGALCGNAVFILVNYFGKSLPGGYWWLLLAPLLEGLLGGMAASVVAFASYVSDTTTEQTRSRTLSIKYGIHWTGVSLGPLLGSLALRVTGDIVSLFYIAVALQATLLLYVKFIMLEPLSEERQGLARANWKLYRDQGKQATEGQGWLGKLWSSFLPIVRPLSVILPVKKRGSSPSSKPRRDWNLFLAVTSIALMYMAAGDLLYKFQYTAAVFGWTAEENGYFLSMLSASRGLYLMIILPLIIKLLKPPTREVEIRVESDVEPSGNSSHPPSTSTWPRISLSLEALLYVVMVLVPSPASLYLLGSLGACGNRSVILSLYMHQGGLEIGAVFGALGVLANVFGQVLSPVLYGSVYVATLAVFPGSIFVISMLVIGSAIFILFLHGTLAPDSELQVGEEACSTGIIADT